ncbi:tissue factor pathway inhibitor-like [Lucilia cuprina]|uniref:tissue factor pathway inhibitor-like n=1 Tax=Lucilia cuprina TaxID=7375 RepID=UPI001F0513F2|nr:tissue factor pathway inhibitor-like [Lucilia cuprina]
MKFPTASLIQFLVIIALKSTHEEQVEAAVGLYGPDRYEGLPEICLMPMDFGYCRAKVQRYYFDIRRMKCTMFFWGGCAGNDNNFKSMDECNNFCNSPYEDHVHNEVVAVKKERTESRVESRGSGNTKYNNLNSRDGAGRDSAPKSVPKFSLKPNVTSKETGYKGSFKASSKSFNINPAPKPNSNTNNNNSNIDPLDVIDDEDYDD